MDKSCVRILNLFTIMDRGGAETMVMNYYRHVDRRKIQFDFMVHREERGAYDDEIESLGGKIFRMSPIRPWKSFSYKRIVRDFYHLHPEYQIIHSHMSELGYYDFAEAKKESVQNRICHAHNRPYGFDIKSPIRWYYKKKMLPYITHMFVCGQESGDWLFGKKNRNKFIMLNNAIDAAAYSFNIDVRKEIRASLNIDDNQLVVGHVGRFDIQKNHQFILDIFLEVLKKKPNSALMLIGADNSPTGEEIHSKAKRLGIDNHILFMGVRNDVDRLMQAMDVFLFPSLFEGLSVASVEAQAAGLPILISDKVPIECKKTDLVKVVSLNQSPAYWAEEVINSKKIVRRNTYTEIVDSGFDINDNARKLEMFYLNLLKK